MRLFIALPLNEGAKNVVSKEIKATKPVLRGKNIRYMPPENWHFTLVFLGDQDKSNLDKIKKGLDRSASKTSSPKIDLKKIIYGPPNKDPRMIWITTNKETSRRLGNIKKEIRSSLESQGLSWNKDNRPFKGHITVARFKYDEVKPLPDIEGVINFSYKSDEIKLMKSELTPHGAKYEVLESCPIN